MKSMRPDSRLRLDLDAAEIVADNRTIPLTPRLLAMLRYFALNPGRLISKQELLENVWPHTHVTEGLVKDYVRKIRAVLNDDARRPDFIETARGRGYRLVGDIAVSGAVGLPQTGAEARRALPSVAVLPFADRSGGADQTFFSTGIAEDIVAELSRFRSLVVIAPDSSFQCDAEPVEIDRVSRDLQAGYIVAGSVRKAAERVRIHAQLIEAASGTCVWAEHYDRELNDVFAVQDEVARAVVTTLVGHLEEYGRQRAARKRPGSLAVYECLLLGSWHLRQGLQADVLRAREMFARAIELEPANARAHAEMAFSYLIEFWSDWTLAPDAAVDTALALAGRAIALDGLDARAHLYLAAAYQYGKSNFEAADLEYEKASRLNPNDYDVFCLRSWLLALSGRAEQGIACAEQAVRLSPLTTEDCRVAQCFAAYGARRYDEALTALGCITEPSNHVNACRAMCYAQLGCDTEATQAMSEYLTRASQEIADYPGADKDAWRRYWDTRYPFQNAADLEHLLAGLYKAGLPLHPPTG